jgi:hypothetical protein
MGAEPGHQEHRRPSTSVPTEASGWRSTVRRSIARLVPQPGQKTSSQGVPATSAAPQHVAAGGQAPVPAVDDELRFEARGLVRLQLCGAGLDVEPSRPDAHGASIGRPAFEVDSGLRLPAGDLILLAQHRRRGGH